jgi:hypothetical protein
MLSMASHPLKLATSMNGVSTFSESVSLAVATAAPNAAETGSIDSPLCRCIRLRSTVATGTDNAQADELQHCDASGDV